jgi:hypothetical protein
MWAYPALAGGARKLPATGWRPPTAAEQAWADAHLIRTEQVRLNRLALTRINDERVVKGLAALSPEAVGMVADGEEAVGRTAKESAVYGAPPATTSEVAAKMAPSDLSRQVDNSKLKYFPPVGDQGGLLGSCASFSTTYYTLTFAVARANDWSVTSASDTNRWMSPRFTYNLGNGGNNGTSSEFTVMTIANSHGCATWSDFPYNGSDFTSLPTSATAWRTATRYRTSVYGLVWNVDTDSGLRQMKAMLANGYLLNFSSGAPPPYTDWCTTVVKNDPATTNDNAWVGQQIGYSTKANGGHAMTVVGYNDDLWVDVNGNGVVDTGEKGALKIANQWGAGWCNNGFIWLMYDALRTRSAVPGWTPPAPRTGAFFSNYALWASVRSANYTPTVLAECVMSLQNRSQITVSGGYGTTNASAPNATNSVSYFSSSGAVAFSGTMVFDLSDFADAGPTSRWFVGFKDSKSDSAGGTVSSVKLTDAQGNLLTNCIQTVPAGGLPKSFNGATVWAYADWQFSDTTAPSAVTDLEAIADPNSVTLCWTAPGDDGSNGVARSYDLRYSPTPITEENWSSATPTNWPGWKPLPGGGQETSYIYGFLPGTTWHFAIRASDEAGNTGPLSNVAGVTVPFTLGISTPSVLPSAFSNHPYSVTFAAGGGVPPYTWSAGAGYVEDTQGTGSLITGTDMNWRTNSNAASWTLSFTNAFRFNSFGGSLNSVTVYNGGYVTAWTPGPPLYLYVFSAATHLDTTGPGEGIYAEGTADQYTIRWRAHPVTEPNATGTLNFQVTLYTNGAFRYTYGDMSTNVGAISVVANNVSYTDWSTKSVYSGRPLVAGATALFADNRLPAEMTLDATNGTLVWVPSQVGTNAFKIKVTDNADVRVMQTAKAMFSIVVAVDDNDNGIADDWEMRHFGGTNVPNGGASEDWDGDGMDNRAEYLAWTNPTNAASALCMSEMRRQGTDFVVVWTAVGGKSYVVQTAPALLGGGFADCSPLISATVPGECVTNWVDAGAMTHTQRFYRVRLGP